MPSTFQALGTATAGTVDATPLVVTAVLDATAEAVQVTVTTDVDDAGLTGWIDHATSPARWSCVRVYLGYDGIDVTNLVGDVQIVRDANAVVPTASFTVRDPRVAFLHPSTWSAGALPVVIKAYCATLDGGSWQTKFTGWVEPQPNEDPYVPRASFNAVGRTSWLAERNANASCVRVPAFAGLSLFDYLGQYIEASGGTIPPSMPTWKLHLHAAEYSGLSPLEMARRFAEVAGYYLRDLAGELEFVWEPNITAGAPKFSFSAANTYALKEVPPAKPTTAWTLACMRIMTEKLWDPSYNATETVSEGVDSGGVHWKTITRVYTQHGITVRTVVEEWKDYATRGVTAVAASFQVVKRTTTETTWGVGGPPGYTGSTAQAVSVRIRVESLSSPAVAPSSGSQWTDLSWHRDATEILLLTSDTTAANTWNDFCQLASRVTTTQSYYAAQVASGSVWADGKRRTATEETWQTTRRETETWADNAGATDPYRSVAAKTMEAWSVTSYETIDAVPYPNETFGIVGTSSVVATTISAGRYSLETRLTGSYGDSQSTVPMDGQTPGPETRSPDVPQYAEEALQVTYRAATTRYPEILKSDSSPDWESAADLRRVALRRLRDALSPRLVLSTRVVPILETLDCVDVTFPERLYAGTIGYLERIVETYTVLSGRARAELTIAFPPVELTPTMAQLVEP